VSVEVVAPLQVGEPGEESKQMAQRWHLGTSEHSPCGGRVNSRDMRSTRGPEQE